MDDYLLAPDYDDWDQPCAILVTTDRDGPYVAPENIEDFVGTRSWGGVG